MIIIEKTKKNDMYTLHFKYNVEAGLSVVDIYKDGTFLNTGTAKCGEDDLWNKKIGRKVAMGRALQAVPKNQRTTIWNHYKKKMTKSPRW